MFYGSHLAWMEEKHVHVEFSLNVVALYLLTPTYHNRLTPWPVLAHYLLSFYTVHDLVQSQAACVLTPLWLLATGPNLQRLQPGSLQPSSVRWSTRCAPFSGSIWMTKSLQAGWHCTYLTSTHWHGNSAAFSRRCHFPTNTTSSSRNSSSSSRPGERGGSPRGLHMTDSREESAEDGRWERKETLQCASIPINKMCRLLLFWLPFAYLKCVNFNFLCKNYSLKSQYVP